MVPGLEGPAGDRAGTPAGGKEGELLTEGVKEEKVNRTSQKLLDISGSLVALRLPPGLRRMTNMAVRGKCSQVSSLLI